MALTKQNFTYILGEVTLPQNTEMDMQEEVIKFFPKCIYSCQNQFELDHAIRYQINFSIDEVGFEACEKLNQLFIHLKNIEPLIDIKLHAGINFY